MSSCRRSADEVSAQREPSAHSTAPAPEMGRGLGGGRGQRLGSRWFWGGPFARRGWAYEARFRRNAAAGLRGSRGWGLRVVCSGSGSGCARRLPTRRPTSARPRPARGARGLPEPPETWTAEREEAAGARAPTSVSAAPRVSWLAGEARRCRMESPSRPPASLGIHGRLKDPDRARFPRPPSHPPSGAPAPETLSESPATSGPYTFRTLDPPNPGFPRDPETP